MKKSFRVLFHVLGKLLAICIVLTGAVFIVCGGAKVPALIGGLLGIVFGIYLFAAVWKSMSKIRRFPKNSGLSPESIDLMNSIDDIDISSISRVDFTPRGESTFGLKTENMKKLAIYITEKMRKSQFEPNELKGAYEHIKQYLVSDETTGTIMEGFRLIEGFIEKGGTVEIVREPKKNISNRARLMIFIVCAIIIIGIAILLQEKKNQRAMYTEPPIDYSTPPAEDIQTPLSGDAQPVESTGITE